tara:strand:- start:1047 stop:2462 length:1416 start_codon:yes stop_codon:yes gene_type:complete
MIRLLFLIAAKFGLFVLSVFIGMGSYLIIKGSGESQAGKSAHSFQPIESLTYRREVAFDAEPVLLARAESPVDLSGDALGVLYILEKGGDIVRVGQESDSLAVSTAYASLADEATRSDMGFSALAFHPQFLVKDSPGFGKFYAVVSENAGSGMPDFTPEFGGPSEHHQDVVYEFITPFPLAANFKGGKREVMRFSQPGPENNLGGLAFDERGYLYLGIGDGAVADVGSDSPSRNASSLTSAYGKVLRIDPTGSNSDSGNYGVPESNPFQMITDALPELWAFGLRAPHSLHFDPFHRSLCIGETAINGREEINLSVLGGEHFGWDLSEGSMFFHKAAKAELEEFVTPPKLTMNIKAGVSGRNTGNIVYRGESFPSLAGKLIFASHDGQLMACDPREGTSADSPLCVLALGNLGRKQFTALRTTPMGELVVLCDDGSVFEMRKNHEVGSGKTRKRPLYCMAGQTANPLLSTEG